MQQMPNTKLMISGENKNAPRLEKKNIETYSKKKVRRKMNDNERFLKKNGFSLSEVRDMKKNIKKEAKLKNLGFKMEDDGVGISSLSREELHAYEWDLETQVRALDPENHALKIVYFSPLTAVRAYEKALLELRKAEWK